MKYGWLGECGIVMKERRWVDVIWGFLVFYLIMNEFYYGFVGVYDLGIRIRGVWIWGGFDFVGFG